MKMLFTKEQACDWARHQIENLEKAGDGPYPEALDSISPECFDSVLYDEDDSDVMLDDEDIEFLNQLDPPRFTTADVVSVVCRAITLYPTNTNRQYIAGSSEAEDEQPKGDGISNNPNVLLAALEELFGEEGILVGKENQLCECDNGHLQARTTCRFCYAQNIYRQYVAQYGRKS